MLYALLKHYFYLDTKSRLTKSCKDQRLPNPSKTNDNVNLTLANEDEIAQFKQQQNNRQNSAKEEQQNTLARLKKQDQHIPIRLMSGGLNDD
jgi:hypothetical protein